MTEALDNLVRIGELRKEAPSASETRGLIEAGEARLRDGENETLAIESRFDLVYNAAHALALAALRSHGYRARSRHLVFQSAAHALGLTPPETRVLSDAHRKRNLMEYEGLADVTEESFAALLRVTRHLLAKLRTLDSGETGDEDRED